MFSAVYCCGPGPLGHQGGKSKDWTYLGSIGCKKPEKNLRDEF